jgi:flagellar operon protein
MIRAAARIIKLHRAEVDAMAAQINGLTPAAAKQPAGLGAGGAGRNHSAADFSGIMERASRRANVTNATGVPNAASGINFSGYPLIITKHAETRLRDRNIQLSDIQRKKISEALEKAERKGVRDALVMTEGLAIVANARSKTIITAVSETDLKQSVFTNIDGVVFA